VEARTSKEPAKEVSMPPVPDGATVEGLWEKLHHEREMWRNLVKQKEQEKEEGIAQVYRVAFMVLAKVCTTFGHKKGEEYVLEIQQPKGLWNVKTTKLKSGNYELHAKKIETS